MDTRPSKAASLFVVLAFFGGLSADAAAQVPERNLTTADARFPEAFGMVGGLRELRDGRILVADPLGQALIVIDMSAGTADTIGRVGAGPGEYKQPDAVFALPGDSTLLVDLGNGRLTVLAPDLSFGETTPIAQGQPRAGGGMRGGMAGMNVVLPRGVDGQGRVYFQAMAMGMRPGGQLPDSAAIMRWDRATGAFEQVGQVKLQERTTETSGSRGNQMVRLRQKPLSPQDSWGVGRSGRIALARTDGYYLEWIEPDGRRVRGDEVSYRPVRIRQAEKERWVEGRSSSGLMIGVEMHNGARTMSFGRGGGGMAGAGDSGVDDFDWPDVMPAFAANGVRVTPEGDVWVRRSVPAGGEAVFDVFGADGQLKERITLPADRRIAGFGPEHVYMVRNDEFDLQWLERYRRTT